MSVYWKQTRMGVRYDLLKPTVDMIQSKDISHALAFQPHGGGHFDCFFSIAEHSIVGARYFYLRGETELAKQFLMHDAHEAYTGDMSSPMKRLMRASSFLADDISDFDIIERRHERVLRRALELPDRFDPRVKQMDLAVLALEKRELMGPSPDVWEIDTVDIPEGLSLSCLSPGKARQHFDIWAQRLGLTVNGRPWEGWE